MPFADMQAAVQRLSPLQVTSDLAAALVNDAYINTLRSQQWLANTGHFTLASVTPVTSGTVSLTQGSTAVIGSGTNWDPSMVGLYLGIGQSIPSRVIGFISSTQLSLGDPWSDPSISSSPYELRQIRFTLPSDARRLISLKGPIWPIYRRSISLIDAYDPARKVHGVPLVFCEVEIRNNLIEVEWWPIPSQEDFFYAVYRYDPPALSSPSDVPLLPEDLITKRAQAEICRILYGRTGNPIWGQAGKSYQETYQEQYDAFLREDRRTRGPSKVVLDSEDFPLRDDPTWTAALRLYQDISRQTA